jgi:hypothetical protein
VRLTLFALLLFAVEPVFGQALNPELHIEIEKIDAQAADPDRKAVVAGAVADHLKIHRNRLALLRRETGQSYGRIFVSELEKAGTGPDEILRQARRLNQEILARLGGGAVESRRSAVRPVLFLGAGTSHSDVGTFYSITPQAGIESRNAGLVLAVPTYRLTAREASTGGLGDVTATGYALASAGRFDLGASLAVGFPTGDRDLGLGAGKTTVDLVAMLSRRIDRVRLFADAGFTNSIFANVGYQRPYITDGNAVHFSGGVEARLAPRLVLGAGGFAVRPTGRQKVVSRIPVPETESVTSALTATAAQPFPPPGQPGRGRGRGPGEPPIPGAGLRPPGVEPTAPVEATVEELRDHGPIGWVSLYLHPAVSLNFAVARSMPFQLTTVHFGLGFDVGRLLFVPRSAR